MQKDQRTIREYEIQYVDTQAILDTLADLGIITPKSTSSQTPSRSTTGTGTSRTSQQQQQAAGMPAEGAVPMALPSAEGTEREITAQEPQIAVLAATNSLLVHATPRQHAAIALVIAHSDRELEKTSAPYMVYALENQDPEELAEVLNKLIKETVEEITGGTTSSPDAKIQTKTTGPAMLPSGEEQRIKIIPDPKTYSLVVYANKRNQQWVGDLIRELDNYRPQVLLDCTLVEVTQNEKFQYDLDIIAKTYGGATLDSGTIIGNQMNFSQDNFLDARSTSGQGKAFFNSENVQALLQVVEEKGYGRVMARPKILVNDNQEGEIKTKNTISVAQVKSNISIPDQGSPVTSTDVTFNDYEAGVTLTIKPHISKGEMLRLEVTLNRTDFSLKPDVTINDGEGQKTFPSPPDRLSTDVQTVSTVPDGTTIILGGLETINQGKNNTKVPILGDIPLIGGLFRGISNTGTQSRLYVFVKANIIRPGDQIEGLEDMKRVSDRNRKAFEEFERKFQKMESWPGTKDRPMDPTGVLEDDEMEEIGRSARLSEKPARVLTDKEFEDLKRRLEKMDKAETVEK